MKTKLIAIALLAGSSLFAQPRFRVTAGFGYSPAPVVVYAAPSNPGPGYGWVAGYWYQVGPRRMWHAGYWTRQPVVRDYRYAPSYDYGSYNYGRYDGARYDRNRYDRGRYQREYRGR